VFSYVLSLKSTKKIGFWVKAAVFGGLVAYIAHVLRQQSFDWTTVSRQIRSVEQPGRWAAALLLLTPVNWGLEALKWQILLQRVERTTFWDACRGVLAGLSLGFALPAQLGDTAGRVLSLRTSARAEAIGASLVSGGMQFYVALVFGALAWAHHLRAAPERNTPAGQWLLALLTMLSLLGIGFGLVRQRLIRWLATRPRLTQFARYWQVGGQYDDREIGLALLVAAMRYLVFSVQFYVAMQLVGVGLPADIAASGIGVVFLVKTITPAFNLLSDLGVREAAALWVFAPFSQVGGTAPASVLITGTLSLWLVNILIPVLVGLVWVWRLNWSVR
jgi:Lysylphosphatidylglycerol synthase TM region